MQSANGRFSDLLSVATSGSLVATDNRSLDARRTAAAAAIIKA
jgi:hypothetical protein